MAGDPNQAQGSGEGSRGPATTGAAGGAGGRTLLVRNCHTLVTMDGERREIAGGALRVRGRAIEAVGTTAELDGGADEVLDFKGRYIVMPGLVNCHHHFCQSLTRVIEPDGSLFPWLKALYPIWSRLRAGDIYLSAQLAAAELLLSGATTTSDHLYLLPNDCAIDDEIRALADIGMRFTAVRGSMSIGESEGGLPPDGLVEPEADILRDSQRLIETHHDMSRHAMTRIALGPCAPFTISEGLMRDTACLAASCDGVRLHTHLAENRDDIAYMLQRYGRGPVEWIESMGWLHDRTWLAHAVHLDERDIAALAGAGTAVAHCPCSNMRLGSGAAPIRRMLNAGVAVSLGVDGSASNDHGNLLLEARQALLLARVREMDAGAMAAREALEIATLGGARALGRDDIGHLAPGMSADFIAVDTRRAEFVGADADPVAALLLCHNDRVDYSFVNGRAVVDDGELITLDYPVLQERARRAAARLAEA